MKTNEHKTGIKFKTNNTTIKVTVEFETDHDLSDQEKTDLHNIFGPRLRGFLCSLPDELAPQDILFNAQEENRRTDF